jgi:abortive infection bacteriophage resistance protein
MSVPFSKPATSIPEQIALLQKRGLTINDEKIAEHYLLHVGYYRLAGYWQIFQNDRMNHTFIRNTTIEQLIELYNFDRELRLLLLDAIEHIEVSFRSVMSDEMCCKYGAAWYADKQYVFDEKAFKNIIAEVDKELDRSNEDFIKHHNTKYGKENYPPAWKTLQILSLGTLSRLYGNIHNNIPERRIIAKKYGLPTEAWLHSWMQVISVLRNYCAHHSRVCYRTFSFPPKDMHRPKLPWIKNTPPPGGSLSQHLYYQLCAVRYLLHTCSPDNRFNTKLKQLIAKYPSVEMKRMGFIPDWEEEDLWQ